MQVGLISTYAHPVSLGLRYISSSLAAAGHSVKLMLFASRKASAKANFAPELLDECAERLRDAGLIGLSLMTNTFHRAAAITGHLRQAGIRAPIVWGGVHPTLAPEESIQLADVVCIGEGERQIVELADALEAGRDPTAIAGLWCRRGEQVIRNPARPLQTDLDSLPFPDVDLSRQWVAAGKTWVPARPENLRGTLHRYRLSTTRGCPYSCAFCNNTALRLIHRDNRSWVRVRGTDNVIAEMESVMARFPTVQAVNIVDDLFFIRSTEEIAAFAEQYCARVNLPLEVDAFPNTVTREKVEALSRMPISLVSMGIQSGSRRTLYELYNRRTSPEKIVAAMDAFSEFGLRAEYHYIVDNPYESDESRLETLRFAATHHRGPAVLRVFPLQFYPGTPLYARARADGIIGERHEAAYTHHYGGKTQYKGNMYLTIWLRVVLSLRNRGIPRWVAHRMIDLVVAGPTRFVLDRRWFPPAAYGCYRIFRGLWKNLVYQPFVRPWRYLLRSPDRSAVEDRSHRDFP